ncbi:hypothetical protein ABT297_03240 [Dactylosporangium sp. NPDC000555]|uniref:hypothetical protein n=1 Tax=Dactylosporangium sp. NPDC000555 TaxID=3154260 RepID=UPI00332F8B37
MIFEPLTADTVLRTLATLDEEPQRHFDGEDRLRWLAARFDAGDRAGAAAALLGELARNPAPRFAVDGPRILAVLPTATVLEAMLESPQLYARYRGQLGEHPDDAVAGTFAGIVAGDPDAGDALLRAALALAEHERQHPAPAYRPSRISAVLAALAAAEATAHAGAPDAPAGGTEPLDRWAKVLAGSERDDRHRLSAAAALLGPLGLAEVDARCARVEDHDGPPLAVELAAAGRLGEALELAARLGPWARQGALLRLAEGATGADAARVLAAFRKCPKADRSRDAQMVWRHRLGSLLLRGDRVDEALDVLAGMKDCRIVGHGPGPLALEILRHLAERPQEATPPRLRAVVAVLNSPAVIPQELAAVVVEAMIILHRLADPPLRADLTGVHAATLGARLRWYPAQYVAAGVGAALVEAGDLCALDGMLAGPGTEWVGRNRALVGVIAASGLPQRLPEVAARLAVAVLDAGGDPGEVVRLLPAAARAHLPGLLAQLPPDRAVRAVTGLAAIAGDADDLELLGIALAAARDATAVRAVARRAAVVLARAGDLPGARRVAAACGMPA